ncbi:MAG: 50S ribosomal protein L11 methyltransferase [Oscillospiraceae bacterium]|nr:50S ribosomal protein L11 methyltransferase [Oscillospiraceae bacterium]MBP1556373.1 50S ribosomal protein L11 methyltransferase [Oscillospiraceae bacterium]MBP1576923.1 50S ribosomal protein L11 methyltransferase [Oscillospiraceae bacterium]
MDWTDLAITVPVENIDEAAAVAQMVAGAGIYIEDYSDLEEKTLEIAHIDLIDEELIQKDRTKAVIHIYLAQDYSPAEPISYIGQRLESCGIPFEIATSGVKEENWATAWKRYYHPIELSEKLAICPSWENIAPKPGQKVICLDPGMAFGTGTHETTRLCLKLLESQLKEGMSMLDVGTGSGILAICAKLLGSGRTVGVDIDPVAVRTAKENAELNNCGDIELLCGDLAQDVEGRFDVICANIVADAILRLAKDLPQLMHEESVCVVSGIIDTRREEVEDGLKAAGLIPFEVELQNGWAAIACKKAV